MFVLKISNAPVCVSDPFSLIKVFNHLAQPIYFYTIGGVEDAIHCRSVLPSSTQILSCKHKLVFHAFKIIYRTLLDPENILNNENIWKRANNFRPWTNYATL